MTQYAEVPVAASLAAKNPRRTNRSTVSDEFADSPFIIFSTYFATMSTSRFTDRPA